MAPGSRPSAVKEHHPALEEYCVAIFELGEDEVEVIQARIAERLEISRPAVSEMVRRLETDGFVTVDKGTIGLTDAGTEIAHAVARRHRLAERFLTDVLGLSWGEAHHEAGKWEHVISPVVESALFRVLGEPTTCPHGNPIPGSDYTEPNRTQVLEEIPVGGSFVVSRIPEELEFQPDLLDYLEDSEILPGRHGEVTSRSPDGTLTLTIEGNVVGVGPFVAARLQVTP